MPDKMRARHDVYGVKDVPDNDWYRNNGWTPVADDTPTAEQERRDVINSARRGTLVDQSAARVAAAMPVLSADDKDAVIAAEKAGKNRKTIVDQD